MQFGYRFSSQTEMVLMIEKHQELQTLRIRKLKKLGIVYRYGTILNYTEFLIMFFNFFGLDLIEPLNTLLIAPIPNPLCAPMVSRRACCLCVLIP